MTFTLFQLEAEKSAAASKGPLKATERKDPTEMSVSGVYYHCPLVGQEVRPREEIELKIREFLYAQAEEEPVLGYALIIQTANKNREKVKMCTETMCKYLDNIIVNGEDEKFRKIRLGNKTFQEQVFHIEGAVEFLKSAGFQEKTLPFKEGEEAFLVMTEEMAINTGQLLEVKEALLTAEPVLPQLDRGLQVKCPVQATFMNNPQHIV